MGDKCLVVIDIIYKFASVATLAFLTWQIKETKQANELSNTQFEDKKKEDNIRHQKDERQKAIEMAELYANELIANIAYLSNTYRKCGIEQYFKNVKHSELRNFDIYELEEIIRGKITVGEMKKLIKDIDLTILVDSVRFLSKDTKKMSMERINILSLKRYIEKYENNKEKNEVAATLEEISKKMYKEKQYYDEAKMKYKTYEICYNDEFDTITRDTFNKLEYFCMYFNSGVADEETVYQSLHQSFLDMIKVIYFHIAVRNKTGKDKYYTNIIKLYNKWSDRYLDCLNKEIENNRNITHEQEKIKK
ncbi:hypothetical protein FDB64_05235 [Clostridium botulinum]|nr:hypothetical protein [Clostridium botulinum]NFM04105.1 hypothetical protein [Clostridium botulinum]